MGSTKETSGNNAEASGEAPPSHADQHATGAINAAINGEAAPSNAELSGKKDPARVLCRADHQTAIGKPEVSLRSNGCELYWPAARIRRTKAQEHSEATES